MGNALVSSYRRRAIVRVPGSAGRSRSSFSTVSAKLCTGRPGLPHSPRAAPGYFEVIAKAAGKNVTVQSFTHAGESLKDFTVAATGGPVSFAPGKPYALGPADVGHDDPSTHLLVFSSKSATS